MPESCAIRVFARLLPARIATDVFEPAQRELAAERVHAQERMRGRRDGAGEATHARDSRLRRALRFAHSRGFDSLPRGVAWVGWNLRLFLLFMDCWRIALTGNVVSGEAFTTSSPSGWFVMFVQSIRHAMKRLRHDPGFSIAAALTLALGVGANVAVFAVVEAVLLRPLPYAGAEDLAIVRHVDERTGVTKEFIAVGDYVDLAERQRVFAAFVGYGTFQTTIHQGDESFRASGLTAAPGLFDAFRLRPLVGRGLEADDSRQGAAPVAVLGHRWRPSIPRRIRDRRTMRSRCARHW